MRMYDVTIELDGNQYEISVPAKNPTHADEVAVESLASRMEVIEITEYKGKDW